MGRLQTFKNFLLGYRADDGNDYDEVDYDVYDYEEDVTPIELPKRPTDYYGGDSGSSYGSGYRSKYPSSHGGDKNQIVSINTKVQMEVVLSYPKKMEEAGDICDFLKQNKTVLINAEGLSHELCQRIIDFLGGVTYALNGEIQSVSDRVFIVAPNNVDISGSFKEELKANGLLFEFQEYEA